MSDQVGNQNVGFLMTRLICSVACFDFSFGNVYLMYMQNILGSVKAAEWSPFGKDLIPSVKHMFSFIMFICSLS